MSACVRVCVRVSVRPVYVPLSLSGNVYVVCAFAHLALIWFGPLSLRDHDRLALCTRI